MTKARRSKSKPVAEPVESVELNLPETKTDEMKRLYSQIKELQEKKKPFETKKQELDKKVRDVDQEVSDAREAIKFIKSQLYLEHIDAFIAITPEHDRTSCSDDNLMNGDRGCTRCVLLEAKRDNYLDQDIEISIEIRNY